MLILLNMTFDKSPHVKIVTYEQPRSFPKASVEQRIQSGNLKEKRKRTRNIVFVKGAIFIFIHC